MHTDARSEDRNKATQGLVLSIFGAVCGALLTNALNGSPTVRLIGTILGAAIPQLISQVGPGHRLRAGLAVSVTTVALFAAYGGFTLFAFASDRKSVVPLPSIVPQPGGESGGNARSAITVSPHSVDCGNRQVVDELLECADVTVTSSGVKSLRISSVAFEPPLPFGQSQDCVTKSPLPKGATCTVHVLFRPSAPPGSRAARMRIDGNAPSAYVDVQGNVTPAELAGDLAVPGVVSCEYVADEASGPALKLTFEVAFAGSGSPPSVIGVSASLDDGTPAPSERVDFPVGQPDSMSMSIPPPPYDTLSIPFTIHLDRDNSVQEEDELNNDVKMKFAAPGEGQPSGTVGCGPAG
jgi:hypothetical protein